MAVSVNLNAKGVPVTIVGGTGVVTLGPDGKIPSTELHYGSPGDPAGPLGADGKLPADQAPIEVWDYQGKWDASTNTPTLAAGVGTVGHAYIVSVAGSQDLGDGTVAFNVGDAVVYDGAKWDQIPHGGQFFVQIGGQSSASPLVIGTTTAQGIELITGGDPRITIDAIGNVGIDIDSPMAPLHVGGGMLIEAGTVEFETDLSDGTQTSIGNTSNHPVSFIANNTIHMTLDANGQILGGTSYVPSGTKSLVPKDYLDAQIAAIPANPLPNSPTATVGTVAVNGSADTFMRSDAAPAINQAIAPTWTGAHTFTQSLTVLPAGGNGIVAAGTNSTGVPSITATGAANNITLDIAAKGAAGINLKSPTAVTGTFSTTGAATFGGNVNVAGNLGSAANTSAPSPTNSGISIGGAPTWAMASFYDQALTANNRTADLLFISNSIKFRFANDARNAFTDVLSINGGQALGVTGITSTSGSGSWAHTGSMSVSGTFNSAALNITQNAQDASATNSGVQIGVAPSWADILLYDQSASANNRTADIVWESGALQMRFRNDALVVNGVPLSISGGGGTGVTGIQSNSGSGNWTHTGDYIATGVISAGNQGVANALQLLGSSGTSDTQIRAVGTAADLSIQVSAKGAGTIKLASPTDVTGAFSATTTVKTGGFTVANLPAASSALQGARAFVTDSAASPAFLAAATGGGSTIAPVFCNGTAWVYG